MHVMNRGTFRKIHARGESKGFMLIHL